MPVLCSVFLNVTLVCEATLTTWISLISFMIWLYELREDVMYSCVEIVMVVLW